MKNSVIFSGGEVKILTQLEKLSPHYWISTRDQDARIHGLGGIGGVEPAISRLIAQVKTARLAMPSPVEGGNVRKVFMSRYVSRADLEQAEVLTAALTGLIKGISKVLRGSAPPFTRIFPAR